MNDSSTYGAGETKEFRELADFFRIMASTAPVSVIFYDRGKEVARQENVSEGYAEEMRTGQFDLVKITSPTPQTVEFVTRYGARVNYDKPPTGDVNVLNVRGAFASYQVTVDSISALLLMANPLRRYLLIQNNDPSIDIWVNLEGFVAGANLYGSIKIAANGGYLELQGYVPINGINAWAASTNANVAVVEG